MFAVKFEHGPNATYGPRFSLRPSVGGCCWS